MEYALEFVCAMGIGTVFVGLIALIIICSLVSAFCSIGKKEKAVATAPAAPVATKIENKQEILAAVSAAVAEELGTDVSAIRITSFKKL